MTELRIRGESIEVMAAQLAGFGAMVEVISPIEIRSRLATIGAELTTRYGAQPVLAGGVADGVA